MLRNRILVLMLLSLVLITPFSAAHAQENATKDLTLSNILSNLGPGSGQEMIWSIFLYLIFFIGLVVMMLIPEKQFFASMLNLGVIGLAILAKLMVGDPGDPDTVISKCELPTLVINSGIFVLPFIIAGMVRPTKGKPSKAVMPAIIMGFLGGAYFFLYWAQEQRTDCPSW